MAFHNRNGLFYPIVVFSIPFQGDGFTFGFKIKLLFFSKHLAIIPGIDDPDGQ